MSEEKDKADNAPADETKPRKRSALSRIFIHIADIICAFLDGIYRITKKVMKFWWVALIVLILFYPQPLLEFLRGIVSTIENIKNLFGR